MISTGTQHTTVEDDNVRYVYQPLEELYIVLITNLQSNILQDIDTLHLLAQIVSSTVPVVDEREVLNCCFEILSAFDEVISLGYRENLNLSQVQTFLEMESHEERIHEIIERNKEIEAAEERKLRAKQLEIARSRGAGPGRNIPNFPAPTGFGRNNSGAGQSSYGGGSGSIGGGSSKSSSSNATIVVGDTYEKPKNTRSTPARGKGLQLGSKKANAIGSLRDISDAETARLMESMELSANKPKPKQQQQSAPSEPANEGILVSIKEEVTAQIQRMGSIESSELKGSLQLKIGNPELTDIQLIVSADGAPSQYRTHPNVDKQAFQQQKVIKVRDPNRPFPGNNHQLGVLRWQASAKADDDTFVPLLFHCWFSEAGDDSITTILEYEVRPGFEEIIENFKVQIPLLSGNVSVSSSDQTWNQYDDEIEWLIPEIVPNSATTSSGSLEWTAEANSENDFFPMTVSFSLKNPLKTFGKVDVVDVATLADSNESVEFKKEVIVSATNSIV